MSTTLTITADGAATTSRHDCLRDARAALIRYQARRGLWFTIGPWTAGDGAQRQGGELMTGTEPVGAWRISCADGCAGSALTRLPAATGKDY